MLFEATTFVAAALIHFDVLVHGFEHQTASIAESVIATVLLTGLGWSLAHGRSIPLATAPVPTARACSWSSLAEGLFKQVAIRRDRERSPSEWFTGHARVSGIHGGRCHA
jgi:hypothetical protein